MKRLLCVTLCVVVMLSAVPLWSGESQPGAEEFVGADTSLFLSWRQCGKLYDDVVNSQFWTKFRTLPGILLLRVQIQQSLAGNQEYQAFMDEHGELIDRFVALLREEVSIAVPNESTEGIAKLAGRLAEVAISQAQLNGIGANAEPAEIETLQGQAADAWKRLLEADIPPIAMMFKTKDTAVGTDIDMLVSRAQQALKNDQDAPFVIENDTGLYNDVSIQTIKLGLTDAARVEALEEMDIEGSLPPDVAPEISEKLLDKLGERFEINYTFTNGYCLMSMGGDRDLLKGLIDRGKAPATDALVDSPKFKTVKDMMDGDIVGVSFVDAEAFGPAYRRHISPLLVPIMELFDKLDPEGVATGPARRQITMLDKLLTELPDAILHGGSVTVRDEGLLSRGFLKVDPEGAGKFLDTMHEANFGHTSVFELENKQPKLLKMLPADTMACAIDVNGNAEAQWNNIMRSFNSQRPGLGRMPQAQKFFELVDKYDKLVKDNLLPHCGEEGAFAILPGGKLNAMMLPPPLAQLAQYLQDAPMPGMVILTETQDGAALRQGIKDIVKKINEDLVAEEVPFEIKFFTTENYQGVEIEKLLANLGDGFQPCYANIDGVFALSTSPGSMRKIIDASKGDKTLADNPRFQQLDDVYKDECMTMNFMDMEGGFDELQVLARFIFDVIDAQMQAPDAGRGQLGVAMMVASIKTTVLQGLDCLKVLKAAGACNWAEGDTIRARGRLRVIDLKQTQ